MNRRPTYALAAALALLAGAILATAGRDAAAQDRPSPIPRAGGGGLYLMPGQLANNMYGVYVIDTDGQTLLVYQYDAGGRQLALLAARDFSGDLRLNDHNTFPPPGEIAEILDQEQNAGRVRRDEAE